MAKYTGTYSCGHEGIVGIIGPMKNREWKRQRIFEGLCPECYKLKIEKEHQEANEIALSEAKEMELKELQGTPKQVAWANTIRVKKIQEVEEFFDEMFKKEEHVKIMIKKYDLEEYTEEDARNAFQKWMESYISAKYWIEIRGYDKVELFCQFLKEYKKEKEEEIPESVFEEQQELELRLTIKSESYNPKKGVVKIIETPEGIALKYEKNEEFRTICKENKYSWSGKAWERKIDEYSGELSDRAAEIGNKLLSKGFTVCFPDEKTKEKAIDGNIIPEITRWIKMKKKIRISWDGYNDDIYKAAKKITGASWSSGAMEIELKHIWEVIDFAEVFGFELSKEFKKEKDNYEKEMRKVEKVEIKEIKEKEEIDVNEALKKKLEKIGAIEDLMDESES